MDYGHRRKQPALSRRHRTRPSRPRLPRPLPLRPPFCSHAVTYGPGPAREPETERRAATRQYRLELIGGLTGPDLDTFVATGFVENATFRPNASGTWRQTRIESDEGETFAGRGL